MNPRSVFQVAILWGILAACSGGELPTRYAELHRMFHDSKPALLAIEREMEQDELWQIIPHIIREEFDQKHLPELSAEQTKKYRILLDSVPFVSYVDKTEGLTNFSLGISEYDSRIYLFQFMHTPRKARPAMCESMPKDEECGVCSSDLGNDWSLWVSWHSKSGESRANGC